MIQGRASLTLLMGLVAVVAAGLAAMKVADRWLAWGLFLLAFVGLLVATLASFVRRDRARWLGVAVFGWGYLLLLIGQSFFDAFYTDTHGRPLSEWQVADLVDEVVNRLHPVPPYPADPFPGMTTSFVPATGRWTKVVAGVEVPFTEADLKAQRDFDTRAALHNKRLEAAESARVIGLTIQGLAFAMAGAVVGIALSDRSTNAGASPGAEPSALPD